MVELLDDKPQKLLCHNTGNSVYKNFSEGCIQNLIKHLRQSIKHLRWSVFLPTPATTPFDYYSIHEQLFRTKPIKDLDWGGGKLYWRGFLLFIYVFSNNTIMYSAII